MAEVLEKAKNISNRIGNGVLDILFPAMCASCGKEGGYVCEKCNLFLGEASLICPVCNVSSFGGQRHILCESKYSLNGLANMWEYEGILKQLISQIKYIGITHPIGELIERAFRTMAGDQQRFASFLSFLFAKDTALTFVPIFKRKEKRRGFNQSQLIAREIGRATGKQVFSLLEKVRETEAQAHLDKEERLQNLKEAFRFEFRDSNFEIPPKVVLVDDVWTTGATMKECAKELKKAGVKEVWGFTLARTV